MFKNKCIIFIMLLFALLSIGIASAEDISSNATDIETVISTYDDLSTEVTTSAYDENMSLDVMSKDNSESKDDIVTSLEDVNFSNNKYNELTNNNIISNGESASKSFTQLKDEIETATSTLTLNSNYKMTANEASSLKYGIILSKNIDINGNGFTIDANKLGNIFRIGDGGSVSLSITVTNCNFINSLNYVIFNGNYKCKASLTVSNCNFTNNLKAIHNNDNNGKSLTISNCNFINNSDAISNNNCGHFTVSNCNFINNLGYAISNNGSSLTVSNCDFINNTATYCGAISNSGSSFSLTVSNCGFINNTATYSGVISNSGPGSIISNCSFINNTVTDGGEGTIHNSGSSLTVSNCSFINNTATYGGAIRNSGSGSTIGNCSFINNTATYGGAIYNSESGFATYDCDFINNTAKNNGGVIYNDYGLATISDSSFINNTAKNNGGVIYNGGSNFTVSNCDFINNTATYGGAIHNTYSSSGLTVSNCDFINNTANNGSAFYNAGSNFTANNCDFINNTANNSGTIYNGRSIAISNSKFKDNNACKGVAIYNDVYYEICIGTINLNNNTYSGISKGKTYIYNVGTILTPVTITVLGNKTINCRYNDEVTLFATITTSFDGASVAGGSLNFIVGGSTISTVATSNDNGIYNYTYKVPFKNICEIVSASYNNTGNAYVYTGILDTRNITTVNIITNDVVMIYKDGSRLYATLLNDKGNPIANTILSFTINGATYNRTTDLNGNASIALNLGHGVYNAVISYAGNKTYKPASVNSTVTIKSSITGQNIVKMYQNDTQFYAKFLDSNGKALAKTKVQFNINGVFYTRETNSSGVAKLTINLRPGNYILTAINPANDEQIGYNVTVKSLVEANNLTKYYKNESKFQATIYDKKGSLAINKEIMFNINGVFYKRTTDSNGVASMKINLRPGNYVISTIVDGLSIGNNVNVLPTVLANDLDMKFQDGSKFKATILDGQGKPLANQNVTFNVNGVFYSKITDADGVASLTINLNRGEYIITSMWNDYQVGNKITIS